MPESDLTAVQSLYSGLQCQVQCSGAIDTMQPRTEAHLVEHEFVRK